MAGASGMHSVFVRTVHQSAKLMSLSLQSSSDRSPLSGDCSECSGPTSVVNTLEDVFIGITEDITFR
jgi:hypothetical protein